MGSEDLSGLSAIAGGQLQGSSTPEVAQAPAIGYQLFCHSRDADGAAKEMRSPQSDFQGG
jgi:hypothetical protein